jgi:hypothetical protein
MTTQQMIENAMLDALGLLSADEQRDFERAFWTADPAVQAHVRREQTRLSRIESLLPKVDPPVDLRAAVIQAVRQAMVAQLAEPEVEEVRGRGPIPILSSLHVSPVWRAASLGFAAAAAVFGATTLVMWSKYAQVESQISSNAFSEAVMAQAGGDARNILYRLDSVALFRAASDAVGEAEAKLHYLAESGEALLAYSDLPAGAGDEYVVMVVSADGERMELKRFQSEGAQGRVKLDLLPEHDGLRLALVAAGSSETLFLSDALRLG